MKTYENHPIVNINYENLKKTYVYPVRILNNIGYIIEATTGEERAAVLELLTQFRSGSNPEYNKIYVYGVRHPDNDWTFPITLGENIAVNKFGWFITDKPFDFEDKFIVDNSLLNEGTGSSKEIDLMYCDDTKSIIHYFNFYKDLSNVTKTDCIIGCHTLDIVTVIQNDDKIKKLIYDCEHGEV